MPDAILSHRSVTKGELILLEDIIVSGSSVTQVDIGGLNLVKGEEYVLVADILHTTTGTIGLLFNANYTQTNYYTQELGVVNATISGSRQNKSYFVYGGAANQKTLSMIKIKLTNNGYVVSQSSTNRDFGGSGLIMTEIYTTTTFTVTSITSIRILGESANAIGIGSRFTLYKTGGV